MKAMTLLVLGALCAGLAACSSGSPVAPSMLNESAASRASERPAYAVAAKPGTSTIVDIVLQNDGEFDVLQAAVVRAGLVEALGGTTQLTVFAPTDQAFVTSLQVADEAAAIAAVNGLPVNALTKILLYHVTDGRRNSRSVLASSEFEMLNGDTLTRAELLDAGLATTDLSATNGIVHVINGVLMP